MAIIWELTRFSSHRGTVGGLDLFVISYNRIRAGDTAVYELTTRLPVRLPDDLARCTSVEGAKAAAEAVLGHFMRHIEAHWKSQ